MFRSFWPQRTFDNPGGAGGAAGGGSSGPWYSTKLDAEHIGHIQNSGWADKGAEDLAVEAIKAHRSAAKMIGVPADELVRLPKSPGDAEGWGKVWSRLGKPGEAKDYDFSKVQNTAGKTVHDFKAEDGKNPYEAIIESTRNAAFAANLTKDAAASMLAAAIKDFDNRAQRTAADAAAALETERAGLKTNWGKNYDAHMVVAKRAAEALGVAPEAVDALEKVVGYSKVMDMFRNIGEKIGEAKFITGGNNGNGGVMTREQATARKAELMRDTAWTAKYLNGDTEAAREMTALNTIIVGA